MSVFIVNVSTYCQIAASIVNVNVIFSTHCVVPFQIVPLQLRTCCVKCGKRGPRQAHVDVL